MIKNLTNLSYSPFRGLGGKYKNMKQEIIIAGFGGQGVLSMGKILAYSGLMQGQELAGCHRTDLNNVVEQPM
jgi:uncharacterized FAD-dependent dehydrogenase